MSPNKSRPQRISKLETSKQKRDILRVFDLYTHKGDYLKKMENKQGDRQSCRAVGV